MGRAFGNNGDPNFVNALSTTQSGLQQPYVNLPNRVTSDFWGSPVFELDDGTLSCPGYTGPTYSKRIWDFVGISIPTPYLVGSMQPQTPGVCEVICDKARDVDKKKMKGSDGARITLAGLEPAMVEIRVTIWTPEQLKNFNLMRPIIMPGPQKKTTTKTTTETIEEAAGFTSPLGAEIVTRPAVTKTTKKTSSKDVTDSRPFNVQHPTLSSAGVSSLIFYKIEGPVDGPFKGAKTWTLKAMEFALPRKGVNSTTTPKSSVAAAGSTLEPSTPGQNTRNTDP